MQMLLKVPAMVIMAETANDEKDGAPQLPGVSMTKLADALTASAAEGSVKHGRNPSGCRYLKIISGHRQAGMERKKPPG